jgi:TPR repeat protein
VLLWEISSGQIPCEGLQENHLIVIYRINGSRDKPVPGTPAEYIKLYTECWDEDPNERPLVEEVHQRLTMLYEELAQKDHLLADETMIIISKSLQKGEDFTLTNMIRRWLYQKKLTDVDALGILRTHNDCGKCFLLVGIFYHLGIGTNRDYVRAYKRYERAFDNGNPNAAYWLGLCYELGYGTEKDESKAVRFFQQAASQGCAASQFHLAMCYDFGVGTQSDFVKASEYYQRAAIQGHVDAQNNLAVFYKNGYGVKKSMKKAVEFFQQAAGQGDDRSQYNLGLCYENGFEVKQNILKALELYQLAAKQGNVKAQTKLKRLNSERHRTKIDCHN